MVRIGLALLVILLAGASVGASASVATAGCGFCVDNVSLQTRDGQPWTAGKPVTLVVHAAHGSVPLPQTGLAVVMQTDGDRTKCLDVPLKLVSDDGHGAVYAGLFFPFRAARYDGKLSIGEDVSDLTFDVNKIVAGAAPAGDLPAAEPIETATAPVRFVTAAQTPLLAAGAIAFWSIVALAFLRRPRRLAAQLS